MSKGNMFLGYARGKVGSVVFSRLDGQQVTRAYNASPSNPKTYRQATQRMLFASMAQYYKSFRYLIEQGQEGIKEGSASVRAWQSKSLKRLSSLVGSTAMTPNRNGWQFPQGIPVSLTDGSLPSLDYSIKTLSSEAGTMALALDFKNTYTTVEQLQNMTLADFLALYPGISNGAQFTVAMAYNSVGGAAAGDPLQYETLALWSQFVLSPEADTSDAFFAASGNFYTINPDILKSSWGGNYTPLFSFRVSAGVDAHAYAAIIPQGMQNDGSGPIGGCVITSYYDGTSWKRSFSPMACYGPTDVSQYIATYMTSTRSASSDLYLNQSETTEEEDGFLDYMTLIVGNFGSYTSALLSQSVQVDSADLADLSEIRLDFHATGKIKIENITTSTDGISLGGWTTSDNDTDHPSVILPVTTAPTDGAEAEIIFTIGRQQFMRRINFSIG